jgi:hypothetical protein
VSSKKNNNIGNFEDRLENGSIKLLLVTDSTYDILKYPPARPRYSVSGSSSYLCPALALGLWGLLIAFPILLI